MTPLDPTRFSFSLPEHRKEPVNHLFSLPKDLPPQNPSTNTLALSWLASTISPEMSFVSKEVGKLLSQVYFHLVAEAIGKTKLSL